MITGSRGVLRSAVAAALSVSALAAGCGGDEDNAADTEAGAPLSESEYAARVEPVGEQIGTIEEDLPDPRTFGEAEFTDGMTALADDTADSASSIEEISPPEILGSEHERLVEALRETEDALRDAATASEERDAAAVREALRVASSNLRTIGAITEEMAVEAATR